VDERTDVYALGVIAYRMLTGRPAFAGKSVPDTLYKVVHTMPPAPGAILPELRGDLERVLAIGMAKRAGDRFDRPSALVEALELAARGELSNDLRDRADALLVRDPFRA
jgi:serine/threonine-protein kinase